MIILLIVCYRHIEFGKDESVNLVVVASTEHIAVWDVFTLILKWSVPLNVSILVADPITTYMAAFSTDNECES